MLVTKAVIPAAGLGTRMQPITRGIPKEMLPVGRLPMLHYSVDEAVAAGMNEIIVIVNNERKSAIEAFYADARWVELGFYRRERRNKDQECIVKFIYQEEPLGVMDALFQAFNLIGQEAFLLLMPDNVYLSKRASAAQVVACAEEYDKSVLGLIELTAERASLFGNSGRIKYEPLSGTTYMIKELLDKTRDSFHLGADEVVLRACGRGVFGCDFFETAAKMDTAELESKDEVPVVQELVRRNGVLGTLLDGQLFDCGNWEGYWRANQYWLKHKDRWN